MGQNISEIGGDIFETNKGELVEQIKEVLDNFGHFHIGEVYADCSPSLDDTKGNLTHLIEYFSKGYCEVNVYCERMGDDKIDSYYLNYEDLSESNLSEILELCQEWEQLQED